MRRILELVLMSVLLAVLLGLVNPVSESEGPENSIDIEAVLALSPEEVLYVDGRSSDVYARGHIPGAIHLSEDAWDAGLGDFLENWSPEQTVVVYCDSSACHVSEQIAERLQTELTIDNVFVLKGGWEVWIQTEQPIESSLP